MNTNETECKPKKIKKTLNYKSCFDIIGPIMIGPSSSHTAGALAIGAAARKLFGGTPKKISIKYYESFADTHKGHGTDFAIIGGILGYKTNDSGIINSIETAKEQGIDIQFYEMKEPSPVHHANTACVSLSDDTHEVHLTGISIGGGTVEVKYIEVDGFSVELNGSLPILIVINKDEEKMQSFKESDIAINSISRYVNDDLLLFVFDLDKQPSEATKKAWASLDSSSKIILL